MFGDWGKDWKLGDQVEVIWEPNNWTDNKTGELKSGWKLTNPNAAPKKPFVQYNQNAPAASASALLVSAWTIAASLIPYFYSNPEKKAKLEDVQALAEAILPKIKPAPVVGNEIHAPVATTPAPAVQAAPVAVASAPAPIQAAPAKPVVDTTPSSVTDDIEDDDRPF